MQRTTENSLSPAGFELAYSGFWTAALQIELSSQLGLAASLIQFKCTKSFRVGIALVFDDAQCFSPISEPPSETWKTKFMLIWHCTERKIRCLERNLNSHLKRIFCPQRQALSPFRALKVVVWSPACYDVITQIIIIRLSAKSSGDYDFRDLIILFVGRCSNNSDHFWDRL